MYLLFWQLLQGSPRSEVSLASVLVHGHAALRKVVLRHLQDTDELPPILIVIKLNTNQSIPSSKFLFFYFH